MSEIEEAVVCFSCGMEIMDNEAMRVMPNGEDVVHVDESGECEARYWDPPEGIQ